MRGITELAPNVATSGQPTVAGDSFAQAKEVTGRESRFIALLDVEPEALILSSLEFA